MRLTPDQKAGIYVTAIIHLAVIIVMLAGGIGYELKKENTFVLDFSKQEEKEKIQEKEELRLSAAEKLEEMLAAAAVGTPIRNIAVDRSQLKDDRGTNAEELYREAERLAEELKNGQNRSEEDVADPVVMRQEEKEKPRKKQSYSGPSVLSWVLEGRQASHLPIPAYRCMGAGEVTVIITVDNRGVVVNAKVDEGSSSSDGCLRAFAIRAARLSSFSASTTAPSRQMGSITYAFIAQ